MIVNFFGNNNVEYIEMASALSDINRIDALEMNVSCPNVEKGGIELSSDPVYSATSSWVSKKSHR